ncbi:MAG TPA: DNA repair protein RecN [Blastocatellia bacterium]|nr:DNA repair protein RecN [Blastocatellia bacterium]
MLRYLNISNLAVVDRLQVEFRRGLNILSGETGSGKSIIMDAVGLLLGEKASADMIRTGESRAYVEGIFSAEGNSPLIDLLISSGVVMEDDEVVIKREIQVNGRSRIFVNNQSATLALLRAIQPHLVDIHGQGDQQSLLSPEAHMRLLDAFAGTEALREETEQAYEVVLELCRELDASRQTEAERLQMLDLLNYQISEIEQAALRVGEDAELEAERRLLANAEKVVSLCAEAYGALYEDEHSILTQLAGVQRRLQELANVDARFTAQAENLTATKYAVEEIAYFLRDYIDDVDVSPERLKVVEERLIEMDRLKRKYAVSLEEILEKLNQLRLRREELQTGEQRAAALEKEISLAMAKYQQVSAELGRRRRMSVSAFERKALAEMAEVALANSRFSVCLGVPAGVNSERLARWVNETGESFPVGRSGRETVEFYFSANPGEELRPISAVASGGELSRLMLVLKTLTAPTRFPRTLIFDEIDSGIGGRVAEAVGQRLRRLAASNQVLCVTHQAQIARHADAHFLVTKEVGGERTTTRVEELAQSERVEELARMIGGVEITALARKHARELLKTGG